MITLANAGRLYEKADRVAQVYCIGLKHTLIASYPFFSDCCCCIVFCNLIRFSELDYLSKRASSRACSYILRNIVMQKSYTVHWFIEDEDIKKPSYDRITQSVVSR